MPSRRRQLGETGKPLRMLTVFWLRKAVTQLPERPPGRPRAAGPVGPAADSAGAFPASLGRLEPGVSMHHCQPARAPLPRRQKALL